MALTDEEKAAQAAAKAEAKAEAERLANLEKAAKAEEETIFQAADEYLQREKEIYAARMKAEREAKIAEVEAPTINIEVEIE